MFARLRCAWRQQHQPRRHFMGGFVCLDCGAAGADLEEMGFAGSAWVTPRRPTY